MTPREKMARARTGLILDHPFFGALALRLKLIEDPGAPTAYTDGKVIGYNPQWIDGLPDAQLKGLIAHEVLHCANGHIWRRDARDPRHWNEACDRAINHHVLAAGLQLPPDGFPGEDRAAEELYNAYPPRGGNGSDPGNCGEVRDAQDDGPEGEVSEEAWKIATVQAARAARAYGRLPECAAQLLDELTRPPIDWRTLLADFVQRTARNDYDWSRANTRHLQRGFILPTLRSNELPAVVVCADTSGSIDRATLATFAGAISDILAAYPTVAHVLAIDAQVHSCTEYRSEDLPIQIHALDGGGGTDFAPAFEYVEREDIGPACLIYLTDLCGSFPAEAPEYPVIWVSTEDRGAPFGEVILIN